MPDQETRVFVTRLRTGKRSLKLPLSGMSRKDLERFRFGDGQEVRVRVTDERLEIRPRRDVGDVQDGLGDLALQLRKLEMCLRTLRSHLSEPVTRNERQEIPTLESEVAVAIDCLLADEILPAIAHLETAAGLTPDALREV
ncbi:MAG TPA: hypothetical protein VN493_22760 [Thermoanaerobaculia bacterium]|nr:hypothetical protein [Thermoanaerobaculia bacterium]